MIFPGPPKRWPTSYGYVHLDGPKRIWILGPVSVEYHTYGGPLFCIGRHICSPSRYSPWWLLWRVIRERLQED